VLDADLHYQRESAAVTAAISAAARGLLSTLRPAPQLKETLRDVVTDIDVRLEQSIVAALQPLGHPVVAEERYSGESLPLGTPFWAVDPLDGTVNWMHHLPFHAVAAGLCCIHAPNKLDFLTGAVSAPAMREHFFCESGKAFLNGRPLGGGDAALAEALVAVSFPSRPRPPELAERLWLVAGRLGARCRGVLRTGSATIQVAYAAAGRYQVAYGLAIPLWDVAGALAVAQAAGRVIQCRWHPGTALVDFIVGTRTASAEVMERLVEEQLWTL
jgi:myo-inositol-1(or 4)-monophosphatase